MMVDGALAQHARSGDASLAVFRAPASVAVIGASDDKSKWGHWVAAGALAGRGLRAVRLVNRGAATVLGEPAYSSVRDLPEAPDLVALCVPAPAIPGVVEEALESGAKGFIAITAGVRDERDLVARIRAAGARLIGPNSLGLYDASTRLELAWGRMRPGSLAIVSQSGQLGSEIARLAARAGLGVSRFISVGNQADVRAAELLADLCDHDQSHTVAVYLESFSDGAALMDAVRALRERGKHTILLTAGISDASRRLALSHTGSLTSSIDAVDAMARAIGAIRVSTPAEVVDLAQYLAVAEPPRGRRVAILSDSGGQGAIAADVAASVGLSVPVLGDAVTDELRRLLPEGAAVSNPVDLAGAGEADLAVYAAAAELLAASGDVDAVVLSGYLGCYGEDTPELDHAESAVIGRLGRVPTAARRPVMLHSMSDSSHAAKAASDAGIPVHTAIERSMRTLAHAAELAAHPGRRIQGAESGVVMVQGNGYRAARDFMSHLGIALPVAVAIDSADGLATAAARIGFPLVLKAGWLAHKSEEGGVVVGLTSIAELTRAFEGMRARLGSGEYIVEAQDTRPHTVELIVGARRDPDLGPMVLIGAGGTETELHRDVRMEAAPVDAELATEMLRDLRMSPRLAGWRGSPPVDVAAVADIVVRLSHAIVAQPLIAELELNPILAGPDGAVAVDAVVVPTDPQEKR
jgi:acyl-CoA synthetase (NDP forming)